MIINKDAYKCPICGELYFFETSKPYDAHCPKCNCDLEFQLNGNFDTELAEKVKNAPTYDPTKDPNSPLYVPVITCPYCHSSSVKKISAFSRIGSAELWGLGSPEIGKNFKCNRCGAYF